MTFKLQILIIAALAIALIFIILQIRNRKLDLKYSLTWFFLILALLILTIFPQILTFFSNLVGFGSQMNMLFVSGFLLTLLIIFTLTRAVSKLMDQVRTLTQKVALLERELRDSKGGDKDNG